MSKNTPPLAFDECGVGPPLVLVHGMASDRRTWDGVWTDLAARRRVIRYDLRGFGQSSLDIDQPYSHTDDLVALMDHLDIDAADLLGASMGGSIALHFALERPARVNRLVLESTSLKGWDWSDEWRALEAVIKDAARARGLGAARKLWLDHPLFRTLGPETRKMLASEVAQYSCRHWLDDDRHAPLLNADLDRLDELSIPTLLITGALDLTDIHLIAEAIHAMTPSTTRIDVENAGHLVHLENQAKFLAAIEQFLQ